jgi:hypothetical protein
MAKMFYTIEEAAKRLGKSEEEVQQMASSGQIQEFRDRDKLVFKTDQIDLLADDEIDIDLGVESDEHDPADFSSMIPLADSSGGDGLGSMADDTSLGESTLRDTSSTEASLGESAGDTGPLGFDDPLTGTGTGGAIGGSGLLSGSGLDSGDSRERTGVGIFDADELEDADPAAMTQMADSGSGFELDALGGSGSGLMDLTRESDDTSLGAEFLEEVIPGDGDAPQEAAQAGALFEGEIGADADSQAVGVASMSMVAAEKIDGPSSGFIGGLSLGAGLCMLAAIAVLILAVLEAPVDPLIDLLASNLMITLGAMAGATLGLGGIGWFAGKRG